MTNSLPSLVIWGGTGNFKVLADWLASSYRILGYFDNDPEIHRQYRDMPWLGNFECFQLWCAQLPPESRIQFLVSIGGGNGAVRVGLHETMEASGLMATTAVHPTAFVAGGVQLGAGSMVFAQAAICVDARIGRCCIINTKASVDHECVLEDGVSIGPGATLAGLVSVGRNADIYTGAVVLPRVRIGAGATVGAGAVVTKDVPDNAVVVGNPARVLRIGKEKSNQRERIGASSATDPET